jgi:hypothetical protein
VAPGTGSLQPAGRPHVEPHARTQAHPRTVAADLWGAGQTPAAAAGILTPPAWEKGQDWWVTGLAKPLTQPTHKLLTSPRPFLELVAPIIRMSQLGKLRLRETK